MTDDALLEPLKGYQSVYKAKHKENAEQYFDELSKQGQVDIAANKKTVQDYRAKCAEIANIAKMLAKKRTLRTFLIVVILIAVIVAGIVSYLSFSSKGETLPIWAAIIAIVVALGILVGFILIIKLSINKIINENEALKAKKEQEAQKLLDEAWGQMAGLNALYDWSIPGKLVTKTVPLIEMDEHFDEKKFTYLHEKYGLSENLNDNISTYFVQSGSILGNPFLLCRDYEQKWVNKQYTGSLTIHWTETVRTNNGTRTVSKSQTLVASIWKPAPSYGFNTYLIYGNEAAPDLKFSRAPTVPHNASEKELAKMVKSGAKKLDKKARNAVTKGLNYTRLGNDEFEVLFGGTDRNNEVQYRLLFTPLAQKNLLNLMKTPQPFGDDFYIEKDCELNFVMTGHSQGADYYANPIQFVDYDWESARNKFVTYNETFFRNLYFELAPLVSIPLYQQHKSHEFIYDMEYKSNVSSYEHESLANSFDINLLRPDRATTPSILKTNLVRKQDSIDSVEITAHAFEAQRRVSYVPMRGGDGYMHNVPVFWLEYVPVEKKTPMAVEQKASSRFEFNSKCQSNDFKNIMNGLSKDNTCHYERGLLAFLLAREMTAADITNINSVYAGAAKDVAKKPTLEEIVRSIQNEMDRFEQQSSANLNDEQATEALLKDETVEAKEVEVNEEDLKDQSKAESLEEDDDDDDDLDDEE